MKKDANFKNPAIPYGLLMDWIATQEKRVEKQVKRNERGKKYAGDDIIRSAMHSGKYHAHMLDLSQIHELKRKIENYREANKIPRVHSLENADVEASVPMAHSDILNPQ